MSHSNKQFQRVSSMRRNVIVAAVVGATVSQVFAANKALNTDAPGPTANFTDTIWTSGATVGTTGGTSAVASGDALFFNTSGATTLNNDLTGASFAGFTFNSGASSYTIGGNAFTLSGTGSNITNNSANVQTFNQAITLSSTAHTILGATLAGNVTTGAGVNGSLTVQGASTLGGTNALTFTNTFGGLVLNSPTGATAGALVNITGATTVAGTNASGGVISIGNNAAIINTVTIANGGSLTVNGTTNATQGGSIVGQQSVGILNVNGTLAVNRGGFYVGNTVTNQTVSGTTSAINISSTGSMTVATGTGDEAFILLGRQGGTGAINLNGGTLTTARTIGRGGQSATDTAGTGRFNFNGGTLKAAANNADWLNTTARTNAIGTATVSALTSVTAGNTSTIDANSYVVGINSAITGTGGFNINSSTDTGTVTFGGTGAKTYTGATNVQDSTLSIDFASALTGASGTGGVNVSGGTLTSTVAAAGLGGTLSLTGGSVSANGASVGSFDLAAGQNFVFSGGTLLENLLSTSSYDTLTGTGTFAITGGTLNLQNVVPDYTTSYAILSGFTSGSVANLSIVNYDTTNYTASLSNAGVLSFTSSSVPEPTAIAVLGLGAMTMLGRRRRTA